MQLKKPPDKKESPAPTGLPTTNGYDSINHIVSVWDISVNTTVNQAMHMNKRQRKIFHELLFAKAMYFFALALSAGIAISMIVIAYKI